MIDFSSIPRTTLAGFALRKCLSLIPKGAVVRVLQGPLKGTRWIIGSQTHGMWLGSYEIEKQLAIRDALKPGDVFYDVGANVGYYSLLASKCVGDKGSVIAFEPLPRNLELLDRHVRLNGASNLAIVPMALSDHAGTEKFFYDSEPSSCHISSEGTLEVAVTALDQLLADESIRAPNVVKVDIEGAEINFLKGAVRTLRTHRPVVFMAIHSPSLYQALFDALAEYRLPYSVEGLDRKEVNMSTYWDELVLKPNP